MTAILASRSAIRFSSFVFMSTPVALGPLAPVSSRERPFLALDVDPDQLLPVDGAFYVYASVARFSNDSTQFCRRMLNEAGVATTPGADFDPVRGHLYLRFSFSGTNDAIAEGVERLQSWLS